MSKIPARQGEWFAARTSVVIKPELEDNLIFGFSVLVMGQVGRLIWDYDRGGNE